MPKISHRVQRALSVAVSLIALSAVAWWVSRQDAPRLPHDPGAWLWLVGALATYWVALALRGWRWHRIMVLAHIPHERADAYGLTLVGYMGNTVLPMRGGEVLRIGMLGARTSARRREILGSILAERLLDATVLAALFAGLTALGVAGAPAGEWPAVVAVAVIATGAAALVAYLALRRRGRFESFAEKVRPVARGSKLFVRREGAPLFALSAVVWSLEGLTLLLIGHSLNLRLALADSALIIVLASLAAVVPAAPGFAGTFDAGIILGLSAVGVSGGAAVGFVLLTRFIMFVPVTLVGLAVLVVRYGWLRRTTSASAPG